MRSIETVVLACSNLMWSSKKVIPFCVRATVQWWTIIRSLWRWCECCPAQKNCPFCFCTVLRQEVTAILESSTPPEEVILKLKSPGGVTAVAKIHGWEEKSLECWEALLTQEMMSLDVMRCREIQKFEKFSKVEGLRIGGLEVCHLAQAQWRATAWLQRSSCASGEQSRHF